MSFTPLLDAPAVTQFHVLCAMMGLILGPVALYSRKRGRAHKMAGYIWVVAMFCLAVSSFFIEGLAVFGAFGPIHLLSVFTLWSLFIGMRHVFAGRIAAHKQVMQNLYWYGIVLAGLFNFLPGRTINRMFFNDMRELGYWVLGVGIALLIANTLRQIRLRSAGMGSSESEIRA